MDQNLDSVVLMIMLEEAYHMKLRENLILQICRL